ncbi:hypothetical protein ZWY2020_042656 [Hordeum vulgare]|nr:hypothetical protein ZWY2020_042656 [Hordeum vulgare]
MVLEVVDNNYFITEDNIGMLKLAKEANNILFDYRIQLVGEDTCCTLSAAVESHGNNGMVMNGLPICIYAPEIVGCTVVDYNGFMAATTYTGGLMNKMIGRIREKEEVSGGSGRGGAA